MLKTIIPVRLEFKDGVPYSAVGGVLSTQRTARDTGCLTPRLLLFPHSLCL